MYFRNVSDAFRATLKMRSRQQQRGVIIRFNEKKAPVKAPVSAPKIYGLIYVMHNGLVQ